MNFLILLDVQHTRITRNRRSGGIGKVANGEALQRKLVDVLHLTFVESSNGLGNRLNVDCVVPKSDYVVARQGSGFGSIDYGWRCRAVQRGTGRVLTCGNGERCHSKWYKSLHESPLESQECRSCRRVHRRRVPMVQIG